ncbi:MAG: HlyD family efflux transporter periplasmic adaptor subunit [Velocimicrobium sp.]
MEEKAKKKRDWIKNVTIIFLIIMLILTFFSNTIMNYSLPEVSTQYTSSGNISSKIRGTASVEAVEPYKIKLEESRKVEEVKIHTGDTIKKGQVLFVLGNSDGTALDEAQDALDAANLEYEQKLLASSPDYNSSLLDIEYAKEDYKAALKAYKDGKKDSKKWDKKVETLTEEKDAAQASVTTYTKQKAQYTRQQTKLAKQKPDVAVETAAYKKAKDAYDDMVYASQLGANGGDYTIALSAARHTMDKASDALDTAKTERQAVIDAQAEAVTDQIDMATENLTEATTLLEEKTKDLETAKSELKAIVLTDLNKNIDTTKRAYQKLKANLDKTKSEDDSKQAITNVELTNTQKKVKRLAAKVTRLTKSGATNEVTSKVEGIVSSVNYVAGDTTTADTELAVIELTDRGYCAKLTVTMEQSKQIREGNTADILNVWGTDIIATVTSIKNDTTNPGKNKVVTFNITGDVSVGQSLELSVGEKSAYYDTIVPNSAIHEDNKGKFVLAVQVKSSPLGNRYIATRLDVQILASDETSSAISGSATGSEFIITTSTKPIVPGLQVRLVEGGEA